MTASPSSTVRTGASTTAQEGTGQTTISGYADDEIEFVADAEGILAALAAESPDWVFAPVSGGHDSLTALHVAHDTPHVDLDAVIHINTTIGIRQTRDFVRQRCAALDLPYIEVRNFTPGDQYREKVHEHGFPGPNIHGIMYVILKERCLNTLCRSFGGDIAFISGARRHESRNRLETVPVDGLSAEERALWVSPLTDWTTSDIAAYRDAHGLPANPVVEKTGMSGECLCGCFADRVEFLLILDEYPDAGRQLLCLEAMVSAAAPVTDIPKEFTYWGHGGESPSDAYAIADSDQQWLCTDCAVDSPKSG